MLGTAPMDTGGGFLGVKGAQAFGQSGATSEEGAIGAQIGAAVGTGALGPVGSAAGAIGLGTIGNMVGAMRTSLTGNKDVDFELSASASGRGGDFANNQYFTTPFGSFGMSAEGTRNMNNQAIGSYLQGMQQYFGNMDSQIASVMTPGELTRTRQYLDGFKVNNANAKAYGRDPVAAMTKRRMEALRQMSPARLKSTGLDKLLEGYNAQYAGLSQEDSDTMQKAMSDYQAASKVMDSEGSSYWGYKAEKLRSESAKDTIKELSNKVLKKDITDDARYDTPWYERYQPGMFTVGYGARPEMQV